VLSKPSLAEDEDIRNFFKEVGTSVDRSEPSSRLDFLSCPVILSTDWQEVVAELESIVEVCCHRSQFQLSENMISVLFNMLFSCHDLKTKMFSITSMAEFIDSEVSTSSIQNFKLVSSGYRYCKSRTLIIAWI
jgi:hypothetical protein